jgi:thiamine-monophosphate kinase
MNEFTIIEKYFVPLASGKGSLNLKDDAALIQTPLGHELVITKDALVQGVHFIGNEEPSEIARKGLRVNLSDLAAMGAEPFGYFLALMTPSSVDENWFRSFTAGLKVDQELYGITLLGGDTTRIPGPLSFSITALGFVPAGQALKRGGANPGDNIYVSGTIGDSALGLKIAQNEWQHSDSFLLQRYNLPEPRVELGMALKHIATACMDISDGLMQDLRHICNCSGTGAVIQKDLIPLSKQAKTLLSQMHNADEIILAGGDDYELLFTASPFVSEALEAIAHKTNVPITSIGKITENKDIELLNNEGSRIHLSKWGYDHFA